MKKILILVVLLFSMNIVLAVPPITQLSTGEGLDIAYPQYTYVPKDIGFNITIHVYNVTSYKDNLTTQCFLDMYNHLGNEIMSSEMEFEGGITKEFEIEIDQGNFSDFGLHSYIIQCNSSGQTGFVNGVFEVTLDGADYDEWSIIFPISLLITAILIFGLAFTFSKEKYIIKSSFYLLSLLLCLIAIQTSRLIITSSDGLNQLSTSSLIIIISTLLIFFLYIFINWTIQTFKQLKNKGEIRWSY